MRARVPGVAPAYRAAALGVCKLHFVDAKAGVDAWQTHALLAPLDPDGFPAWDQAQPQADIRDSLDPAPAPGASFGALPPAACRRQSAELWQKALAGHVYQNVTLALAVCPALKLVSRPGESPGDFTARAAQGLRERRDAEMDKLRTRYAPKLQTLGDQIRRAEERVEREKAQAGQQKMQAALHVGTSLLGALFGRRLLSVGTISRAGTAARSASRIGKEAADVTRAAGSVAVLRERLAALEQEFERDSADLKARTEPGAIETVAVQVRPRKTDIAVLYVGLCWMP